MSRNTDGYSTAIEMHKGRRKMLAVLNNLEIDVRKLREHIFKTDDATIINVASFEMSLKDLSDNTKRFAQRYAHYKNTKYRKPEAGK